MADTFFGFDSSLNNGDSLLPPDDDCIENEEEEYDALNDETFGALEDISTLDDWEQQHEQYAEIAESTKHSEQIENSLSQLVFDDSDEPISLSKNGVWSYTPTSKNGDSYNSPSILSSLQKASKAFIESHIDLPSFNITNDLFPSSPNPTQLPIGSQPKKICTVEELEKNLIKSTKNVGLQQHGSSIPQRHVLPQPPGHLQGSPYHPMFPIPNTRHPPPGLPPLGIPPPMRHMNSQIKSHHHPPMMPPGMMRMVPPNHQYMQNNGPPHRPPGLMYPPPHINNNHFTLPSNFPFPPPVRGMNNAQNANPMNRNHMMPQMQQRTRHDSGGYRQKENHPMNQQEVSRDEYDGLMTTREKQWLLNIQLLQLNTGTPYFDDYYYTVFKERKAKNTKENFANDRMRFQNNRQQRNNERQENSSNTMTPRVYTPLQFENSLGKLQCGSVTAPRKIIDMDIVTPDKDGDSPAVSRDTRKTKQLLLELEALYSLLLKAEDLKNPLAITNMQKLREIKQKQRLRELELAPTPEQKQEILRLFKLESEPIVENQYDYILKIVQGLLHEDKFASFLYIRKGKMLLLRILPHLSADAFPSQLLEIWSRALLSLPTIGRRDTAGDNLLPKLHPYFKRYIQTSTMSDILEIVTGLVEVVRQENSRSTPLSHQGKAPLYFVLLNKFGVSALVILLIRTEFLISTEKATEKQQNDWSNFVLSWAELTGVVLSKVATPLELIPLQIFNKHCNRFVNLTTDKKSLLEKHFVDCN